MAATLPKNYPTNHRVRPPAFKGPRVARIYRPANDPFNRYQRPTPRLFTPGPKPRPFGTRPLPMVTPPTKVPPLVGPALKAARLLRWHPWFRIAFLAYDAWALWHMFRNPYLGYMMPRYGWSLKCDSGGRPLAKGTSASNDPNLPCGLGYQTYKINTGNPFTATQRWVAFGRSHLQGQRMYLDQQWTRPNTDPVTVPYKNPFWMSVPSPRWSPVPPAVSPMHQPIGQPAPAPWAVPYPLLPILSPPGNRPPDTEEAPARSNGQRRLPRPKPKGERLKFEVPATTVEHVPGKRPVSRPQPHKSTKPPRNTKERKTIVAVNSRGTFAKVVSAITETRDLVDAVYKALPKKIRDREKAKTLQDKAAAIYRNLHRLNVGAAVANLIANQIEDNAFGRIGRINARESRRSGRTVGFQFGPVF